MTKKILNKTLFIIIVVGLSIISYFSFYWLFVTSIKPEEIIYSFPPVYLFFEPILANYIELFTQNPFGIYYMNSVIVAIAAVLLALTLGSMIAYALSRLQFKGKMIIIAIVLTTSMFPPMTMVLPIFSAYRDFGLLNTYTGLVMVEVAFGLPQVIFLLFALLQKIPMDLEEAALIDGAGRLRSFVSVIFPLAAPAMATAAILMFVFSWNEYLFPLTLASAPSMKTLTLGIQMYTGEFELPWATVSAGIVLTVAPLIVLILFFQRKMIEGLQGGVKG